MIELSNYITVFYCLFCYCSSFDLFSPAYIFRRRIKDYSITFYHSIIRSRFILILSFFHLMYSDLYPCMV